MGDAGVADTGGRGRGEGVEVDVEVDDIHTCKGVRLWRGWPGLKPRLNIGCGMRWPGSTG